MTCTNETRCSAVQGQANRHDRASAPSSVVAVCASLVSAGDLLTISVALPPGRATLLTPAEIHSIGEHVLRVLVTAGAPDDSEPSCAVAPATEPVLRAVATQETRIAAAADAIRAFIDAQCVLDKTASVQASVLRKAYGTWASSRNMPRLCGQTFGMAMGALGYERQKSCNILWWGLRLERREAGP